MMIGAAKKGKYSKLLRAIVLATLFWTLFWRDVSALPASDFSDLDALRYVASHGDLIEAFGADSARGRSQ